MTLTYKFCFTILIAIICAFPFAQTAFAADAGDKDTEPRAPRSTSTGPIAPQTCDTDVWQTMEMRAKMETEREIMQNQNLIFKPDSILAYTCFDKFAEHAAQYGGVIFTHTTYWNGKEIIPWGAPDGMDHAMKQVVLKSMKTYIDSNFPYSMLGGRGEHLGGTAGLDTYVTSQAGKGDYACNVMNAVWKAAKCMNFIHNDKFKDTDGYYPFIDMKGHNGGDDMAGYQTVGDVRKFPDALKCTTESPVDKNTWYVAWLKSRNENSPGNMNRYYDFSKPLKETYDKVREKVEPGECADPIFTGVKVIESAASGGKVYNDGVCTNPGCVFTKNEKCEVASGS